jgi:hypothetical protein
MEAPGTVTSWVRRKFRPTSLSSDLEAGEGELENGHRRRAVVDDEGRLGARGQLAQDGLGHRGHLRVHGIEAGIRLQVDLDHGLAVHRGRLEVLDVVHRLGEHPRVLGGDPSFHLFRIQAGELPGHRDDWDVDVRKDIGGRPQNDHRAQDEDQEGEDDEGVGTIESDLTIHMA